MTNIKTRKTRWANRLAARIGDLASGRWLGVVPPSTVLRNNCKCRNYGRYTQTEQIRRQVQALFNGKTERALARARRINNGQA